MPTLTIRFTGICMLVPNRPWPKAPSRVCVLLPDLRPSHQARFSLDELHELDPHYGFARLDRRDDVGEPLRTEILYLNQRRVWLSLDGAPQTQPAPLGIAFTDALEQQTLLVQQSIQQSPNDLAFVANLEMISPDDCEVSPQAISTQPPPEAGVLTQVLIDGGTLEAEEPNSDLLWRFPGTLAGVNEIIRPLSDSVFWRTSDISHATLKTTRFDGSSPEDVPLDLSGGDLTVTIVNVCQTNPLEWDIEHDAVEDVDFAWHYELLSQSSKFGILRRILEARRQANPPDPRIGLPVPSPIVGNKLSPSGDNCRKSKTGPANLDALFESLDGS